MATALVEEGALGTECYVCPPRKVGSGDGSDGEEGRDAGAQCGNSDGNGNGDGDGNSDSDSVLEEIRRLEALLATEDNANQTRMDRTLERATRELELTSQWVETEQLEDRMLDWYVRCLSRHNHPLPSRLPAFPLSDVSLPTNHQSPITNHQV